LIDHEYEEGRVRTEENMAILSFSQKKGFFFVFFDNLTSFFADVCSIIGCNIWRIYQRAAHRLS